MCTLRPSPWYWGAAPGTLAVWGQLLQGWYKTAAASPSAPCLHVSVPGELGMLGISVLGPAAEPQQPLWDKP